MLILPAQKRWTLRHFPALTLALAAVNILVFFALQSDEEDMASWQASVDFYQSSGLAGIEDSLYERHLREMVDTERLTLLTEQRGNPAILLQLVETDERFLERMASGAILAVSDPAYEEWAALRERLNALAADGFTERFMLHYRDPSWYQWLTHAFLHGGSGHLFGNMLFLILIGVLVEPALRPGHFLLAYAGCAILAGLASWLLHTGSVSGMLGASGAIAGLMGMFTTLYARRKVRFVYWILVYFDYVRAPAIILLPAWLGWELAQLLFVQSNVAYEAHAAGLASGAFIGWGFRRLGRVDEAYLDSQSADDPAESNTVDIESIRQSIRSLDIDRAQKLAQRRCAEHPHDLESRQLLYQASRFTPERGLYHEAARWLLLNAPNSPQIVDNWLDYRQVTEGRVRLSPQQMTALAQRLLAFNPDQARRLVVWLRKKAPGTPGLEAAIQSLRQRLS